MSKFGCSPSDRARLNADRGINAVPAPLVETIPTINVSPLPFTFNAYLVQLNNVTISNFQNGDATFGLKTWSPLPLMPWHHRQTPPRPRRHCAIRLDFRLASHGRGAILQNREALGPI
jgi:hypothetical protein